MKTRCSLKPRADIESYTDKETKCFVCDNSIFKVARITPELVMMKCTKCGEIHMIAAKSADEEVTALTFWDSDAGPLI
jgi:translation initiation factor 2 beta subunit (eIF-2beta)/eIF-5